MFLASGVSRPAHVLGVTYALKTHIKSEVYRVKHPTPLVKPGINMLNGQDYEDDTTAVVHMRRTGCHIPGARLKTAIELC